MKFWRSTILFFLSIFFIASSINAQTFDGEWTCNYATIDDAGPTIPPNATGYNTVDVGVISPNKFVALVWRPSNNTNYLVGYEDADSLNGRLGEYGYGSGGVGGFRMEWTTGFDIVEMSGAADLAIDAAGRIYVANNDVESNILVFEMSSDSVVSSVYRMATGEDSLWAIHVDGEGRVYVASINDGVPSEILIYNTVDLDPNWAGLHQSIPLTTLTMPEAGGIGGITSTNNGNVLYVSNYTTKKIYCFTGDPLTGYTQYSGFDFTLNDSDSSGTVSPGPIGISFMKDKNILFMAADVFLGGGSAYPYGKIFAIDPNNGNMLDTIDVAAWNFMLSGSYSNRPSYPSGLQYGNMSGYTSTYSVDFDSDYNLYSQSYYGWTVEKWGYSGTLPVIPFTITSVEKNENVIPDQFELTQNYPNPFNPSTTIEFSVPNDSKISLKVYNINGELIATLINSAEFGKGSYRLTYDASKLASGTYLYVLNNGSQQISRKMTLIK